MGLVILYMYSVSSSWVPSRSTTSISSISNEGSHLQVGDQWEIGGGGYRTTCYLLLATCYLLLATCYLLLATCYLLLATCYVREQPIEALAEGAVVAKDRVGHRGRSEQTAHLEESVYTVQTPCRHRALPIIQRTWREACTPCTHRALPIITACMTSCITPSTTAAYNGPYVTGDRMRYKCEVHD